MGRGTVIYSGSQHQFHQLKLANVIINAILRLILGHIIANYVHIAQMYHWQEISVGEGAFIGIGETW
jgi:hypothetical protein